MNPKLTKQEQKVYNFIRDNYGCTTHDITIATYIQKPCARLVGLKKKGIEIEIVGKVRYGDSQPFKKYALKNPLTKTLSSFQYDPERNCMVEVKSVVNV
jgi:hypothetical protein